MWVLECSNNEALGGKRMWIRPGSRLVLGRKKEGDVTLEVTARSVSRTHLIINVGDVTKEDGKRLHMRSTLTLQDCSTKHGTKVDGVEIKGINKVLQETEHVFTLGKHAGVFKIRWEPIVLSFKDIKSLATYPSKMKGLDIKTIATWTDATTHTVTQKRNTALGLQALVNGRYIVTTAYLEAIAVAAAKPVEPPGALSLLETDFDAHWPNPADFLPVKGKEPNDYAISQLMPDPLRKGLLEGWTVVFFDKVQYINLLAPIMDAGGKADKFIVEYKKTIAPDILDFMRKWKGREEVALVSFEYKLDVAWSIDLVTEVQQKLGFEMVKQNSFLDIIVTMDTNKLRVPLEYETPMTMVGTQASSTMVGTQTSSGLPASGILDLEPPERIKEETPAIEPRKFRSRRHIIPAGGFSFDLGGEFVPAPIPDPEPYHPSTSVEPSLSAFTGVDEFPFEPPTSQQYPQKRPLPPLPPKEEYTPTDVMSLLPGSRVIKRRKLAEEAERARRAETERLNPPSEPEPQAIEVNEIPKQQPPTIGRKTLGKTRAPIPPPNDPFSNAARTLREEQAGRDAQSQASRNEYGEVDVAGMRNLGIVEFVPLRPRHDKPVRGGMGDESERWKDEWNGRKNFKGFRRAGRGGAMRTAKGRVIIGVVEHKGRDFGLGDGYWVDGSTGNGNAMAASGSGMGSIREGALRDKKTAAEARSQIRVEGRSQARAVGRKSQVSQGRTSQVAVGGRIPDASKRTLAKSDDDDELSFVASNPRRITAKRTLAESDDDEVVVLSPPPASAGNSYRSPAKRTLTEYDDELSTVASNPRRAAAKRTLAESDDEVIELNPPSTDNSRRTMGSSSTLPRTATNRTASAMLGSGMASQSKGHKRLRLVHDEGGDHSESDDDGLKFIMKR